MQQYLEMARHVLQHGQRRQNRTGIDTIGTFGYQYRVNLQQGFPLLTTKRLFWKGIVHELLWFLRGDTNLKYLHDHQVHIWDEWADAQGDLGPIYGAQWRKWPDYHGGQIDQIARVIELIKQDPDSRRMLVSAWNVAQVDQMKLPPCHALFQFYVCEGTLSCQLYQRSADLFLGVPFNLASYALLTVLIAHTTGLTPGEFVHTFGDLHIYVNHLTQLQEQLNRNPRPLPRVQVLREPKSIELYTFDDIELTAYDPWPTLKAEVAV